MRSPWFAVSSLVLCLALAAPAETRPHYGGVLRIETHESISTLPASDISYQNLLGNAVSGLIYPGASCDGHCNSRSGPFKVAQFIPGKKLTLVANDGYALGRPYLDSIEITMGRAPRDQMLDLQLGRADVIDLAPESIRRAQQQGMRVSASAPLELVAIVFSSNVDEHLREALAFSVDRNAIFNVLLGRQGAPSAALLPDWMTGYAFVFDANQDIARARQLRQQSQRKPPLTVAYDPQDTLARSIAERVALDARVAGLAITPTPSVASPDARLVRILLPSADPNGALTTIALAVAAPTPDAGKTAEQWYAAERELLDDDRIIPLLHLPVAYGLSPQVKDWPSSKTGEWSLEQVWLEQKP